MRTLTAGLKLSADSGAGAMPCRASALATLEASRAAKLPRGSPLPVLP